MSVRRLWLSALLSNAEAAASAFAVLPANGYFKFTEAQVIGSTVGHLANFINAGGGVASVTLTTGTLPSGLSLAFTPAAPAAAGTIYLTGTVAAATTGNYSFTATVTTVNNETAQFAGDIRVDATDQLQLQPATFYREYTQGVAVVSDPITDWVYDNIDNTSPTLPDPLGLPPGLDFTATDTTLTFGTISIDGTPTQAGLFTGESDFVSTTVDTSTLTWAIRVLPGATNLQASISNYSNSYNSGAILGTVQIGTFIFGPVTSTTVISGSAGGSITFSCDPAVASGNIYISGTVGAAGVYTGTFRITNGSDNVDITFTLTVTDPVTSYASPSSFSRTYYTGITVGAAGQTYDTLSYYYDAGGVPVWQSGTVPPGSFLTISPITGTSGEIRLNGVPTSTGTWNTPLQFTAPGGPFTVTPNVITVLAGGTINNPLPGNGGTFTDTAPDGSYIYSAISLSSTGILTFGTNLSGTSNLQWFTPLTAAAGEKHWVRFTLNSVTGSTNGGISGSTGWQILNTLRGVNINSTFTNNAPCTANYTVQIARDAAGTQIVSSGNFNLRVYNVTPGPSGAVVNPLPGNGGTYYKYVASGGATVRVVFGANGEWQADTQPPLTVVQSGSWYAPNTANIGNTHYIRYNIISGPPANTGTLSPGIWANIGAGRIIGLNRSTPGLTSGTYQVQIATDAGGTNIVGQATYTLEVEREFSEFF